jgi:predicted membrane-bound spermidine synthase
MTRPLSKPSGLALLSAGFSSGVLGAFWVINNVPLQLAEIHRPVQMAYLAIYYLVLMLPFIFSGMIIVLIFSRHAESIHRLYFFDLTGAAAGCVLILPLFRFFGGPRAFFVIAALGLLAGLVFSRFKSRLVSTLLLLPFLATALFLPAMRSMPLKVHDFKRTYKEDQEKGRIEYSEWSALSKIDIALAPEPGWKRLWIDGGTNESALVEFDGHFGGYRVNLLSRLLIALPYRIKERPDVAIIGSSGGREVLAALNNDPASIDAIEMDPTICRIVQGRESDYIGNIFHDPRVRLICDEGRSFIKRSGKRYDVIQQVNNFTPIAMASGAINVSESYLLTLEAFEDYWEHLKPGGYLVLNRHNTFKIAVMAEAFLEKKGKDASRHIVVIEGPDRLNNGFFLKKGPFTDEEIARITEFAEKRDHRVLYTPLLEEPGNWYVRLLQKGERRFFQELHGVNLDVPTDNRPFFEHIEGLGIIDTSDPHTPAGIRWIHRIKKFGHRISVGDLTLVVLFVEASLLSGFFIFLPLLFQKKRRRPAGGESGALVFFFGIGLGYIIIELCLIQKFVLFLGVPIYSISMVIFALLSSSGAGSYLTRFFAPSGISRRIFRLAVVLASMLLCYRFFLSRLLNTFLHLGFPARLAITMLLIAPLGLVMGMFFPQGIQWMHRRRPEWIPWVWGLNAYATVIGSVLGVAVALAFGFHAVLYLAAAIYLAGSFALLRAAAPALPSRLSAQSPGEAP